MSAVLKPLLVSVIVLSLLVSSSLVFASPSPSEERETLEKELQQLEEQIAEYEQDIKKTKKEQNTFKNKITILRNQIKKLNLQIYQSNKIIGDLSVQILDTSVAIDKTALEIEDTRQQLGAVLQLVYEQDQRTIVEVALIGDTLSDFFDNLMALEALNQRNREVLENIRDLKNYLSSQKEASESEKEEEEHFVKIQTLQKQESQGTKSQQEYLLEVTKGKESTYQKLLSDSQKRAQEIRSRIFELIGVPDAPTFGEALEIAKVISAQTGVRPALLLAVLTQESNIGRNVGQCFLRDPNTGEGIYAKSGNIARRTMKPSRDVQPFLQITKELGRDPFNTPVSCPMSYGWGGAMGPAQFIPSTWMAYRDRLRELTGRAADPWSIKDAFLAAALYLTDYGAAKQTYNGEWRAAMIYFSGSTKLKYRFYGDSVMAIAAQYEEDIKALGE